LPQGSSPAAGVNGAKMTIEWNDSFCIGDVEINQQHQYLFSLINRFLTAGTKQEQTLCVIHLFKYTREHFAYEEDLMRKVRFPEYEAHVMMHDRLVSRLGELSQHIVNDTLDIQELEGFIREWALGHIPKADARLARYLNRDS
jgi:hemerythrin